MRSPKLLLSIVAAVASLALVGCGSDDAHETEAGTTAGPGTGTGGTGPASGSTGAGTDGSGGSEDPGPHRTPTGAGKITSFPLPALQGAPFSSVMASKHTNMASEGTRIYVTGGDWTHSATDGTWSMSLADGSWQEDVGEPVYPTLPAPHALQDGAGFFLSEKRAKFLLWPGSYFAYESPGDPILEYAKGLWWFDPAAKAFTQELGLFGTSGSGTGNFFGGIYDELNDQIVAFVDSSGAFSCRRWDVANLVELPDLPFDVTLEAAQAAYFMRGMHIRIGREVFVLGYRSKGTVESQTPLFMRWDLDQHTMEELAPPPVDGTEIIDLEIHLGASHGNVVWPFTNGPEGVIHGIYVYDPEADTWLVDDQVPDYGTFIGNSVMSLPDQRVVWSGGVFGEQQTHIWFYEVQ